MADLRAPEAYWDRTGLFRLVTATLIGGAAWAVSLQTGYSLVKPACRADQIIWLTIVNSIGFAGAMAGILLARGAWLRLRTDVTEHGGRPTDRSYFMALVAIGLNALFGLLIALSTVPQLLRLPCE